MRFKRAVGFGAKAVGGRYRRYVGTLAEGGTGSLREACSKPGSWVSFEPEMGGTLFFEDEIVLAPGVRVDGSRSRVALSNGGGQNSGLVLSEGNNVVRYLTFADWGDPEHPAKTQPFPVPVYLHGGENYYLSHLTFARSGGKIAVMGCPGTTISWCHWHPMYKGIQIGDDFEIQESALTTITMHHNWFEGVEFRAPRIKAGYCHYFNNLNNAWKAYAMGALCGGRVLSERNIFVAAQDKNAVVTHNNAKGTVKTPACEGNGTVWSKEDVFLNGAFGEFRSKGKEPQLPPYAYRLDPTEGLAWNIRSKAGNPFNQIAA